MSLATIFNCELKVEVKVLPMFGVVIFAGNMLVKKFVGALFAMALFSSAPVLMLCSATLAYACACMFE